MSDLKEKVPSETPSKPSAKSFDEWLKRFEQVRPYVSDLVEHALDFYALKKADSKDVGRVTEARRRRPGR